MIVLTEAARWSVLCRCSSSSVVVLFDAAFATNGSVCEERSTRSICKESVGVRVHSYAGAEESHFIAKARPFKQLASYQLHSFKS